MTTIVWDVDDVLNDLMRAWLEQVWAAAHPQSAVAYGDVRENPPHRVLGIELPEYLDSLDAFRLSEAARGLAPNHEIRAWLEAQGHRYRHVALTARPLHVAPPAAEWVLCHFGDYIRTIGVVPCRLAPGVPPYDQSKGDFLRWLGRSAVLVDDSEENVRGAEAAGARAILYPQPWNSSRRSVAETLATLAEVAAEAVSARET